jgi:hypothetical protein
LRAFSSEPFSSAAFGGRFGGAFGGFYLVSRGDWRRLLACLLGFLLARILVTRFTRGAIEAKNQVGEGGAP